MTAGSVSSNTTSITNSTEDNDYYCTEMPVGPWIWGGFSVPCACVGVPASAWLLWVLVQRQRSGLSNDVYMLNLTVMDLMFNVFTIPCVLNYLVWRADLYSMIADILYCFNLFGRPLFMACICVDCYTAVDPLLIACVCVDCYTAVVHPITYMKMKRSRYRLVACAVVWSFTLLYAVMGFINRQLFTTSSSVFPFLLAFPAIVFCDVAILRALRKPDPSGRSDVHPQKQRALQTITNSLIMSVVCYLPPLVVFGFLPLMPMSVEDKMCVILMPVLIAPMIGSAILPLLFLGNLGKLKGVKQWKCVS